MANLNKDTETVQLTNKARKETLEISSTGYGLESVVTDIDNGNPKSRKNNHPNCGGL